MTINPHARAVLDLLDADNAPPALVVLDGYVPDGTVAPYVLVYFTVSSPTAEQSPGSVGLTFDQTRVVIEAFCHSVASGTTSAAAGARAVATRVRNALLNVRPTVSGRTCTPLRHVDNQPPQRDESTGSLVFDQIDVYRYTSVPA